MSDPSIDGELLDDLQDILEGRGRDDAITSSELSDRLGLEDGEASPKAREAVRVLRDERSVPVRAGNVGYWICQTQAEADEYLDDLRGRIAGIEESMQNFREAWGSWRRPDPDVSGLTPEERQRVEADPILTVADVVENRGGGEA
jgi:hypothetical protein